MASLLLGILKNDANEMYLQNRNILTNIEKLMVVRGER